MTRFTDGLGEVTWTCEACGLTRPDDKISVLTVRCPILGGRTEMARNIRYCADAVVCHARAYSMGEEFVLDHSDPGQVES